MLPVFILCSWRRSWIKRKTALSDWFQPVAINFFIIFWSLQSFRNVLILLLINLHILQLAKKNSQKLSFAPLLSLLTSSSCLIFLLFFWNNHLILVYTHITFITWDTTLSSIPSSLLYLYICVCTSKVSFDLDKWLWLK